MDEAINELVAELERMVDAKILEHQKDPDNSVGDYYDVNKLRQALTNLVYAVKEGRLQ